MKDSSSPQSCGSPSPDSRARHVWHRVDEGGPPQRNGTPLLSHSQEAKGYFSCFGGEKVLILIITSLGYFPPILSQRWFGCLKTQDFSKSQGFQGCVRFRPVSWWFYNFYHYTPACVNFPTAFPLSWNSTSCFLFPTSLESSFTLHPGSSGFFLYSLSITW